jgi:acyl-CoA thioesterase-1
MRSLPVILLALLAATAGLSAQDAVKTAPAKKPAAPRAPNPAFAPVTDKPGLPRVLLIGDSISIGYTVDVQRLLAGKANVHRIPENGGPTRNGLAKLDQWLGDTKWDVIHFNWGLHDLKFMADGKRQVEPAEYESNLRQLVQRLKATGATLIWCHTTPVPKGKLNPPREFGDVAIYNDIAARVMKENGVIINDLHAWAAKEIAAIQKPADVHFTAEGSAHLARQVAQAIAAALPRR